jgi:hypothetical protein
VKEHVTPHADWCQGRDGQVFWDPEDGISMCRECGAVTEEHEVEGDQQMTPEVTDGHEA